MTEPVNRRNANELILSDGTYAYTQDTSKGIINVHTGPIVVTMTGQETPVKYNPSSGRFDVVDLEKASQVSVTAPQGSYIVLLNPSQDSKQPEPRDKRGGADLLMGQKVNIPGPVSFPLWPRQTAQVIPGHSLRSNQYLLVRIYDEESAKKNWKKGVMKPVEKDAKAETAAEAGVSLAGDIIVGKLLVIRGNEVSFYIPPTGVEVVQDENTGGFIRDALTLEQLEYCILVDESGKKRYVTGPAVVFPEPTERFLEENKSKSFGPIELNKIQGVHVKVIADYKEGEGESAIQHREGDELFITGNDTPIYFPRPEHSLISYDGRVKHYATAIPAGEGRYVLERLTGKINLISGPAMILPDPRKEVLVRRVLSDKQCQLWYPGNNEALEFNRTLRYEMEEDAPMGAVAFAASHSSSIESNASNLMDTGYVPRGVKRETSFGGSVMSHKTSHTKPRQVTLNTKYEGVPTIDVWTGYAVMIVSKTKGRRVEIGPKTIMLAYDESLEVMELSTGKPKTTDRLIKTAYLRVKNNQVTDIVSAETKDHVRVEVKLSVHVNFIGEQTKWFDVENYVKHLTDHVRSLVKGSVRQLTIEQFYANSEKVVRDAILGQKVEGKERNGLKFASNGMEVTDVEVLVVSIPDASINKMLADAQHQVVADNILVANHKRKVEVVSQVEETKRDEMEAVANTHTFGAELARKKVLLTIEADKLTTEAKTDLIAAQLSQQEKSNRLAKVESDAAIARKLAEGEAAARVRKLGLELDHLDLKANTEAAVARFAAAKDGLAEAVVALSNQEVVKHVASAMSVQTLLGGGNLVEVTDTLFGGNSKVGRLIKRTVDRIGMGE